MARSCLPYLVTLQAHGLTPALLERFASFVNQEKIGAFIFHVGTGGTIVAYEEHHKARVETLDLLGRPAERRNAK